MNPLLNASHLFTWPVRVYYEDTDSGGVVYYANYLRFLERARTEWLRAKGFEQTHLMTYHHVIFVVRKVQIDYLSPARFNDTLSITVQVDAVSRTTIEFAQSVVGERECARARVKVACVDAVTFRPARIPNELVQTMESCQNGH